MGADRQPKGVPVGGQFAATAHAEPRVDLSTYRDEEHRLERGAVNAIYTAGRGFGRNRHGNHDRIDEAWDAAGAYADSLGDPRNEHESAAREVFRAAREQYEADKDTLSDKDRRDRKFEAARKASWIIEYRSDSYNNQTQGQTS